MEYEKQQAKPHRHSMAPARPEPSTNLLHTIAAEI
jgi:hypothetical protein